MTLFQEPRPSCHRLKNQENAHEKPKKKRRQKGEKQKMPQQKDLHRKREEGRVNYQYIERGGEEEESESAAGRRGRGRGLGFAICLCRVM